MLGGAPPAGDPKRQLVEAVEGLLADGGTVNLVRTYVPISVTYAPPRDLPRSRRRSPRCRRAA